MSGDPSNVSRAPIYVSVVIIEHVLEGGGSEDHVAADGVHHSLSGGKISVTSSITEYNYDNRTQVSDFGGSRLRGLLLQPGGTV